MLGLEIFIAHLTIFSASPKFQSRLKSTAFSPPWLGAHRHDEQDTRPLYVVKRQSIC